MTQSPWTIRRTTAQDASFLTDMLMEAVNWSPEWKKRSRAHVLSSPATAHYVAGWRGRGLGRAVLQAIAEQARSAGIGQISLSVERKNFAQRLYLSEGYRIVDSSDQQSDTMIKDLA